MKQSRILAVTADVGGNIPLMQRAGLMLQSCCHSLHGLLPGCQIPWCLRPLCPA